jgi:hypothetical protein
MLDDEIQLSWWSIPQAVAWIVTCSDMQVLRAGKASMLSQIARMALRPTSHSKDPPISAKAAVEELQKAWQARRIAISGRVKRSGPSSSIPVDPDLRIQEHHGEVWIGDASLYRGVSRFWSDLWVRGDDCKRCWSAPPGQRARGSTSSRSVAFPSDDAVFAFLEERRKAFRAEGKKAGREELLRAVMLRFNLQRKVALDVWNHAPHDRKGGRPKKGKVGKG